MNHADLEVSQEVRLVALRQLVACAIAAGPRGEVDSDATLDEVGRRMIKDCLETANSMAAGRTESRNTVVSGFTEEVSQGMDLAKVFRRTMRTP